MCNLFNKVVDLGTIRQLSKKNSYLTYAFCAIGLPTRVRKRRAPLHFNLFTSITEPIRLLEMSNLCSSLKACSPSSVKILLFETSRLTRLTSRVRPKDVLRLLRVVVGTSERVRSWLSETFSTLREWLNASKFFISLMSIQLGCQFTIGAEVQIFKFWVVTGDRGNKLHT